jgi:hypothetical protein
MEYHCKEMKDKGYVEGHYEYKCASHDKPKDCSPLNYAVHTIAETIHVLTSESSFAIFAIEKSFHDLCRNLFRRTLRIYLHLICEHPDSYKEMEKRTHLFHIFYEILDLMPENIQCSTKAEPWYRQEKVQAAIYSSEQFMEEDAEHGKELTAADVINFGNKLISNLTTYKGRSVDPTNLLPGEKYSDDITINILSILLQLSDEANSKSEDVRKITHMLSSGDISKIIHVLSKSKNPKIADLAKKLQEKIKASGHSTPATASPKTEGLPAAPLNENAPGGAGAVADTALFSVPTIDHSMKHPASTETMTSVAPGGAGAVADTAPKAGWRKIIELKEKEQKMAKIEAIEQAAPGRNPQIVVPLPPAFHKEPHVVRMPPGRNPQILTSAPKTTTSVVAQKKIKKVASEGAVGIETP